jgi:hypothetical protein
MAMTLRGFRDNVTILAKTAGRRGTRALGSEGRRRRVLAGQASRRENGQRNAYEQRLHFFFPAICHSVNGERTPRIFTFRQ